ncbi:MAG: hypothetical protein QOG15_2905 [Solirubrobacteraceae bacterium]|jgi:hypothetical protein|nr:hypothetical protein [Solirubrobacteraceae bacterium]
MLGGLFHEIVRRRLWPIPLVALLIAVAAPLLFLKSSSGDPAAPLQAAQSAPDAVAVKPLPVRARRLLKTSETAARSAKKPRAADPFQAPPSAAAKNPAQTPASPSAAGAAASGAAAAAKQAPVPVVITGADGKTTTGTISPGTGSGQGTSQPAATAPAGYTAVDVRYARTTGGQVHRAIPRLRPFTASGVVLATFVKYSPKRNKATFAISPTTVVTGSARCRKVDGLCRYVELGVGKHVQLYVATRAGKLVVRRITVVRIAQASGSAPPAPVGGACLLNKMSKLGFGDPPVASNACE